MESPSTIDDNNAFPFLSREHSVSVEHKVKFLRGKFLTTLSDSPDSSGAGFFGTFGTELARLVGHQWGLAQDLVTRRSLLLNGGKKQDSTQAPRSHIP